MKMIRRCVPVLMLLLAAVPLFSSGAASGSAGGNDDVLPVRRIVLFSTGLGFYQRAGTVSGDETVDLYFRSGDINDLLKSLVLQDVDGGTVSSVNYASRESLDVMLRSLAVNLSGNPGKTAILSQLRGEDVILVLDSAGKVSGTIVGVEGNALNIYSDWGMRDIDINSIESIRFADPYLDSEFRKALELIAEGRNSDEKRVSLNFAGVGERRVFASYLLAAPVWKTSYRLSLGDETSHTLQGWAIVENTTDRDWDAVELILVSGRPVSFIMDLYRAVYTNRPVIQPEVQTAAAPKRYDEAVPAPAPMAGMPSAKAYPGEAAAPESAIRASSVSGLGGFDDFAADLDLSAGVEASASAEQAGEFFRYAIEEPVSLPRKEAAMVPIVSGPIEGSRVSIYNQGTHAVHPFNGLRLTNTSGADLMAGPLTVYESGTYAGDALLDSMSAGDERIISFSVDLNTRVSPRVVDKAPVLVGIELADGLLEARLLHRRETSYSVAGRGLRDKSVMIEHPFLHGWDLAEPPEAPEKTANYYRFMLDLPGGGTEVSSELLVAEERTTESKTDMMSAGDSFLQSYIDSDEVDTRVKTALRGILDRRSLVAETAGKIRVQENNRSAIHREQDRIRRNMENLEKEGDLYRQYVETLTAQESRLKEISEAVENLLSERENRQKELERYVAGLQVSG